MLGSFPSLNIMSGKHGKCLERFADPELNRAFLATEAPSAAYPVSALKLPNIATLTRWR